MCCELGKGATSEAGKYLFKVATFILVFVAQRSV